MAKNAQLVLLGYDDELITDKQKSFIDCTVNKIGGKAVSISFHPYVYECEYTIYDNNACLCLSFSTIELAQQRYHRSVVSTVRVESSVDCPNLRSAG